MATRTFTSAGLTGAYAVTISGEGGRAPFAALGILTFDGIESFAGSLLENRPGARFDERVIVEARWQGRYQLAEEGLGTMTPETGEEIEAYLAVREASGGGPSSSLVEEIAVIFRELDPATGSLRVGIGRRLPSGAVFSNASLKGRYTGFAVGRGGQTPMAGFGVLSYDGAGRFSEANVSNAQGQSIHARQFVRGTDQGRYQVNADGTGTVADGGVMFVITRGTLVDGVTRADEYGLMVRNQVSTNGAHFTGVVRRVSD